ncbi:MAG: NYN domain-containing protein [archaeon]
MIGFDSFEVRTKPLQFANNKVFQKGVDVQIAVDMITHAYNNNFDLAILCSDDVDLIESIKVIKNLGKKVVVCSSWNTCAKNIRKEADIFIDMTKFIDEEMDKFTIKLK